MSCEANLSRFCAAVAADLGPTLGATPSDRAAVLEEVVELARTRAAQQIGERGKAVAQHKIDDLAAKAQCAQVFLAMHEQGCPPPVHGAPAAGLPFAFPKDKASWYAYAQLGQVIDAAHLMRPLPELAAEIVQARSARSGEFGPQDGPPSLAERAHRALTACPALLDRANGAENGEILSVSELAALRRQSVSIAEAEDMPERMHSAAFELTNALHATAQLAALTEREPAAAQAESRHVRRAARVLATYLCDRAGLERCPRCGRFRGAAAHSCPPRAANAVSTARQAFDGVRLRELLDANPPQLPEPDQVTTLLGLAGDLLTDRSTPIEVRGIAAAYLQIRDADPMATAEAAHALLEAARELALSPSAEGAALMERYERLIRPLGDVPLRYPADALWREVRRDVNMRIARLREIVRTEVAPYRPDELTPNHITLAQDAAWSLAQHLAVAQAILEPGSVWADDLEIARLEVLSLRDELGGMVSDDQYAAWLRAQPQSQRPDDVEAWIAGRLAARRDALSSYGQVAEAAANIGAVLDGPGGLETIIAAADAAQESRTVTLEAEAGLLRLEVDEDGVGERHIVPDHPAVYRALRAALPYDVAGKGPIAAPRMPWEDAARVVALETTRDVFALLGDARTLPGGVTPPPESGPLMGTLGITWSASPLAQTWLRGTPSLIDLANGAETGGRPDAAQTRALDETASAITSRAGNPRDAWDDAARAWQAQRSGAAAARLAAAVAEAAGQQRCPQCSQFVSVQGGHVCPTRPAAAEDLARQIAREAPQLWQKWGGAPDAYEATVLGRAAGQILAMPLTSKDLREAARAYAAAERYDERAMVTERHTYAAQELQLALARQIADGAPTDDAVREVIERRVRAADRSALSALQALRERGAIDIGSVNALWTLSDDAARMEAFEWLVPRLAEHPDLHRPAAAMTQSWQRLEDRKRAEELLCGAGINRNQFPEPPHIGAPIAERVLAVSRFGIVDLANGSIPSDGAVQNLRALAGQLVAQPAALAQLERHDAAFAAALRQVYEERDQDMRGSGAGLVRLARLIAERGRMGVCPRCGRYGGARKHACPQHLLAGRRAAAAAIAAQPLAFIRVADGADADGNALRLAAERVLAEAGEGERAQRVTGLAALAGRVCDLAGVQRCDRCRDVLEDQRETTCLSCSRAQAAADALDGQDEEGW